MEKQGIWSLDKQRRDDGIFVLILLLFGLGFSLPNAHLQLASDDIGWLRGEAPTVFDQYRYIPRIFFVLLHGLFGPSPVAALVMIFLFHFANSLLVSRLCLQLLNSQIAARVAASVFVVNPITLSTLTWFSCFSYVQGTTLALMSLLAFLKSSAKGTENRLVWSVIALICYSAGLFCSHEFLFLPVFFLLFSWQFSRKGSEDNATSWLGEDASYKRGAILFAVAMVLAMVVNLLVYDFGRYGIDTNKLFSFGFVSAFVSSALSFGLSLGLAYPLSFFIKTMDFLHRCFSEPLRWVMTLALLASGILFYKPNRTWRLRLVMAISFMALITPYIIRLYLMPDGVNYHISYVLSGRVFYLPFILVALIWGGIVAKFYEDHVTKRKLTWLLPVLSVAAYFYALIVVYDRTDFMGLEVLHGSSQSFPPPWTPYAHNQLAWPISSVLVIIAIVAIRFVVEKLEGIGSARHEATSP